MLAAPLTTVPTVSFTSEKNFERKLNQSGVSRLLYGPERRAEICKVSVGRQKLRVIPRIEELRTKLGIDALGEVRLLDE